MADDSKRDTKDGSDDADTDNAQSGKDGSSSDDSDQDASGGDVAGGKDGDSDTDDAKGGRAGERIATLVEKNKKLEERNDDLATRMEALETALAKGGSSDSKKDAASDDNPAIKELRKLGYTDDQIEAAKQVYRAVAGQTDSELKKEVKALQLEIAANKEKEALNQAIIDAKDKGIEVTPGEIEAQRQKWAKSKDPREQLLAEAPYSAIIQLMGKKSVKKAEDEKEEDADESKTERSKEPKVPGGKDSRQEKKPASRVTKFDPGNAIGGMDAIERRVLASIGADEE